MATATGLQMSETFTTAQIELCYKARTIDGHAAAAFEVELVNCSTEPVGVEELDPLLVTGDPQLGFRIARQGNDAFTKVLTNGRMYHDPGRLVEFATNSPDAHFESFFNAALYCPGTSETLVVSYLDGTQFEPHIRGNRDATGIQIQASSVAASCLQVAPGQTVRSGEVVVFSGANPFDTLESYADLLAQVHHVRLNPIINGWCTWSNMYGDITEDRVMKNARVIAKELKPYGMEWVQIDDGYQRGFGDWEAQTGKLPKGMKDLATQITSLGLKPGIWLAPFAISKNTAVATDHPDWLAHRVDGTLQEIEPAHQAQAQYILDVSKPESREWLRSTLSTVANDWGYKFVKTDFSEWTLLATECFADRTFTTAKAYYAANDAIRTGIGPGVHLLDCGPAPEIIGLADSMRIELDRPVAPDCSLWDQYAQHYNSTGPAVAKRYYFHGRTWINDADHIRLNGLDLPQCEVAATITALSGGTMISGDQLYDLDSQRMQILKKVFPSCGKAARPIDLFETTQPALFVTPFTRGAQSWKVAGIFNWGDTTVTRVISPERLGFHKTEPWLAFDFWREQLVCDGQQDIQLVQPARSVSLLAVRTRSGTPQLLGTTRNCMQGAVELEDVAWNSLTRTLSGKALGSPGMSYDLFIYVPETYKTAKPGTAMDSRTHVARLPLRFDESSNTKWSLAFAASKD
jgi:alpha-galactosidase